MQKFALILASGSAIGAAAQEVELTKDQKNVLDEFWSQHEHDTDVRRWDSETYGDARYWNGLVAHAQTAYKKTAATVRERRDGPTLLA